MLLINRGLLRFFSILMKATLRRAFKIKTLRLALFRKIQILAVTTQYLKGRRSRKLRTIKVVPSRKDDTPVLENQVTNENVSKKVKEKLRRNDQLRRFYTRRNISGMSRRHRFFLLLHMRKSFVYWHFPEMSIPLKSRNHFIIKSITRSLFIFKKLRKMTNDFFNPYIFVRTFQWTSSTLQ